MGQLNESHKDAVIVHIGALFKRTNSDESEVCADDILGWGKASLCTPPGSCGKKLVT